jgi:hypothetical protein
MKARHRWLTPIILATREAEIRRIVKDMWEVGMRRGLLMGTGVKVDEEFFCLLVFALLQVEPRASYMLAYKLYN